VQVWHELTVQTHQTLDVIAAEYFIGVQGKPQVYVYNGGRLVRPPAAALARWCMLDGQTRPFPGRVVLIGRRNIEVTGSVHLQVVNVLDPTKAGIKTHVAPRSNRESL
jgi:hypothetical protein